MVCAVYVRLSREDADRPEEGSESIRNQKALLLRWAAERGWTVWKVYCDENWSGADRRRPEFNRMLREAKAGRFQAIVCKSQSRFTRDMELVEKYIHGLFPVWGIRFIGLADNADTDNKGNKKSRQINGLVNEWYLEDMSENIRSVLTNRRQNGYHIGAFAAYGYKKDPEQKGRLLIDEEAAAVVREVFTLFSQGYGKTAIARMLNDRGVPNPTEYKRRQGLRYQQPKGRGGTLWKYSAISSMLVNEVYIGNMVQGKYGSVSYKTKQNKPRPKEDWIRVEGTHEPIVDRALWDRVQALLSEKAKPFTIGEIGIFARKVRCIHCGYTLRSQKCRGRHYLKCRSQYVAKDACTGAFIAVEQLEQIVLRELRRLSEEYLDKDALERGLHVTDTLEAQRSRIRRNMDAYRQKVDEYTKGIRDLYLDKVKGILSEEDFVLLSRDFSDEKQRLEHLIETEQHDLDDLAQRSLTADRRKTLIERYTEPEHLTREMVDVLIDHIEVGRRVKGEKYPPVAIYWNF